MEDLHSVVYVSTARMPMSGTALEDLLVEARRLNAESHVTGVLLCSEGSFIQCFEGAPAAVDETWDRIRKSRRHSDLMLLMNEPVAQRCFSQWLMGFSRATPSDVLTLSTAEWRRTAATPVGVGCAGMELLQQFWKNAR